MGCKNCSKCDNKDSCSDKKECNAGNSNYKYVKQEDIKELLKTVKYGPGADPTPLDYPCKHWGFKKDVKRGQCLTCIRSWVMGVGLEEAKVRLDEEKGKTGNTIFKERLERAINELVYSMPIEK